MRLATLTLATAMLTACSSPPATQTMTAPANLGEKSTDAPSYSGEADAISIATGNTAFGLDAYQRFASEPGNIFISPASITTAFGLLRAGAAGTTAEELDRVLHITLPPEQYHAANAAMLKAANNKEDGNTIAINNAIWVDEDTVLEPDYMALVKSAYGAKEYRVDYRNDPDSARKEINDWVEDKTNDRIKNLLSKSDVKTETRNILVNTIHMKADWAFPFTKEASKKKPFHLTPESSVDVDMMHQVHPLRMINAGDIRALELPYKNRDLSMIVLLPNEKDGLPALEAALADSPDMLGSIAGRVMTAAPTEIALQLPKLKLQQRIDLSPQLKALGMVETFADTADLSAMAKADKQPDEMGLKVSNIVHQTFIEVDEKGTEAAAATAIMGVTITSTQVNSPSPIPFHVEHPYMFVIRQNETGMILFIGRIEDPR